MTTSSRQREIERQYLKSEQHRENLRRLGLVKPQQKKASKGSSSA